MDIIDRFSDILEIIKPDGVKIIDISTIIGDNEIEYLYVKYEVDYDIKNVKSLLQKHTSVLLKFKSCEMIKYKNNDIIKLAYIVKYCIL
ncbi:unknown similar to AMEV218 [Adoxophyes honmai entomopoxvirus 'L']|uniref:Uncharacterized protein n=1 Tax=Adoxophyes honmai entomopoxvirus 'L' TaxID=1293540 RepID=A0A916KP18_9POXV|nr:unknown similar to AMEV218 [Adoxophyes honmai entomopoxvirus 'L']CCU55457.1 unknown similar to AMEV218 [Adoxophyes honmai entomopoxvirus 'L']